MPTQNKHS